MKYFIPKIDIECESFEETESSFGKYPRHEYHFKNSYGASVVHNPYSYGLELAVLKHNNETEEWNLTYDTDITDDVVGYIDGKEELEKLLTKISQLEKEN
ncbi:hypothetical protein [Streptococcus oralis]|uniref:hypothetical protein n=1 Tax=Streptococcus oralis TaxID=1303 RepID=UPI0022846A23|nr:hypothetical protein [Streptococcus oralis]MCY7087258.1 hypothetical protein [Streptococcus oralis]